MNRDNIFKSIIISISLILVMYSKSYAELDNITFNNLNISQGISQSTINVIFQDSKGYIWLGTDDGLNKYNGYDYKIYNYEEGQNSISNNGITDITEDDKGNLWVSTLEGLSKIDLETDKITNYTIYNNKIKNYNITEIIFTSNNQILATTYEGLYLYNESLDKFEQVLSVDEGLLSNTLYTLSEDDEGNIWLGSDLGVNKVSKDFKILKTYSSSLYKGEDKNEVYNIYCDLEYDLVWVGTGANGLYKLDTKTEKITNYQKELNNSNSLPSNDIGAILRDNENNLWIGTSNGLCYYNEKNDDFEVFQNKIYDKNSLVYNDVNSLFQDNEGVIWVGTYSGISIFETENIIKHYKAGLNDIGYLIDNPDYDGDYLLAENMVHGIYEGRSNHLWVGSKSKGVSIIDLENNTSSYINTSNNNVIKSDSINDITGYEDLIFIATQEGFIKVDLNTHQLKHYSTSDGLVENKVKDLLVDSNGYLWVGTTSGISILDINNDKFIPLSKYDYVNPLYIRHMHQGSDGKYYIGLLKDNGLLVLDPESESHKFYKNEKGNTNSISSNRIRYINEDSKGNIWIGTSYGLNKFDPSKETFTRFTAKNGLPNNTIYGVLIDKYDNIWVSTNRGLSRLSSSSNYNNIQNFGVTDGLQSNEFNGNAAFQNKDGVLYFGGVNGLNAFSPQTITKVDTTSSVLFDGFTVGNKVYQSIDGESFHHDTGAITINFFTPTYSTHKKVRYEYRLVGASEKVSSTQNNHVTYNDLSPGQYTFEVSVIDTSGNKSDLNKVSFEICPPFWSTPTAYFIYILILVYAVFRHKYRVKVLDGLVNKRTKKLEAEMKKNIILLNKNIQLEKNKNSYFVNLSHELRTPLNVMTSTNQLILELLRKNTTIERDKFIHYIDISQKNSKRLLNLINNIVDTSKLQDNMYVIDLEETDIVYLVEETALSMAEYINSKDIELIIDPEIEEKFIMCSPDEIERCIINLVGNAAKFTPEGGKITVSIKDLSSHVMISVTDTGCGIDKKYQELIFNRFNQVVDMNNEVKGGSGLGLTITKQLVCLHKGRIFVNSEVDKGSKFTIVLPVNPNLNKPDKPSVPMEQI